MQDLRQAIVRVAKKKEDGSYLILVESLLPLEEVVAELDRCDPAWSFRVNSVHALLNSSAVLITGELTLKGVTRGACVESSPSSAHQALLMELTRMFGLGLPAPERSWVVMTEEAWRRIKDKFPMPWAEAKRILTAFQDRIPIPQTMTQAHEEILAWLRENGRTESWLILRALEEDVLDAPVPGVDYLTASQAEAVLEALRSGLLSEGENGRGSGPGSPRRSRANR